MAKLLDSVDYQNFLLWLNSHTFFQQHVYQRGLLLNNQNKSVASWANILQLKWTRLAIANRE